MYVVVALRKKVHVARCPEGIGARRLLTHMQQRLTEMSFRKASYLMGGACFESAAVMRHIMNLCTSCAGRLVQMPPEAQAMEGMATSEDTKEGFIAPVQDMRVSRCVHVQIQFYTYVYVRTYVRTYVCIYVCVYVCTYVHMYTHISIYIHICICIFVCVRVPLSCDDLLYVYMWVHTYMYM